MPGIEEFHEYSRFSSCVYPTRPHILCKTHPEPRNWREWSDTELLERFRPDVVLVEEAAGMRGFSSVFWGGYGKPVATEYGLRTNTPTVSLFETDFVKYAEYYFGRFFFPLLRPILTRILQRHSQSYTTTFFPSKTLLEQYRKIGVLPSEHLAFHGIDCREYQPDNIQYDPIPGVSHPLLLFVGRIVREKNLPVLFRAFELILRQVPNAHLAIVGTGSDLPRVRQQLARLGASATVWGESFGNELKGWYARADLFLNPSISENFCTTNLEAFASGTPVIAADAGGNSEQVISGVNGFLTRPNCADDMAEKAVRVLRSAELRQQLSKGARENALLYDTNACMERLEDALYRLIQAAPSGGIGVGARVVDVGSNFVLTSRSKLAGPDLRPST